MVVAAFRAWPRSRKIIAVLGLVAGVLGVLVWWRGERFYLRWVFESPSSGRCQTHLNRLLLSRSIQLGTGFLLAHQRLEGNFDYEYDWREDAFSDEDQETRQAGALWGLALLYQDDRRPQLAAAIEHGLAFFDEHSRLNKDVRCTIYPGSGEGTTGTIALVALSYIEYLRAAPNLASERRTLFETRLGEYLQMLVKATHPSGLWYGGFDLDTCKPHGDPSSYSDGEALLALAKAAKYLGRKDLLPDIMRGAAAGKRINIDQALAKEPDSDVTKGFYQWSTMAFYELATSDFPETKIYGDTVLRLADWMIDEHAILGRRRNTGYAFEGLTHAYALAKQRGDHARQAKYGCVIDIGLEHLLSWQVGGPRSNRYTATAPDAEALGGIQNSAFEPALRIDVTQHQMHATQLARQYVY
jgi:hypothetical protein